jgi:hypothetical protein
MKNIALFLSVLVITLTSCSEDTVLNQDTILLKKYTSTMANGQIFTNTITYNGNKIVDLTQQGTGNKWVYTYTGNLITKVNVYDNIGTLTWTIDYFYNNDNLVAIETVSSFTPTIISRVAYTHNIDSTINAVYSQIDVTTKKETITPLSIKFYFTNGNLVKKEIKDKDNGSLYTGTNTYLYDTKKNPFKNVLGFNKIQEDDFNVSVNNLIGGILSNNQGGSAIRKNSYLYNADNFPVERKVYSDENLLLTTQFFYE